MNSWFNDKIPEAKQSRLNWIGLLPMAHCRTLLMASRLKDTLLSRYRKQWPNLLQKTWKYMDEHTGTNFTVIDIDLEALEILESRLFSQSEEAGIAGNQQWGLDVGCHQDNSYPYMSDHDVDHRVVTDSEHGLHYVYENGTIHEHQMKDPPKRSATEDPKDYFKPMPRPILKKRRRKI
ncbi:hypothetical protein DFS33DRAFT_1377946 [Desarmillaria ectypa]|nr:hypothetical protein DFS33DRAFT_1377946 [Desarmillaria ectypa]